VIRENTYYMKRSFFVALILSILSFSLVFGLAPCLRVPPTLPYMEVFGEGYFLERISLKLNKPKMIEIVSQSYRGFTISTYEVDMLLSEAWNSTIL